MLDINKWDESKRVALKNIKSWVQDVLSENGVSATVLVNELACSIPGCEPVETVVGIFASGKKSVQFKLLKPAESISSDDIKQWMTDRILIDVKM